MKIAVIPARGGSKRIPRKNIKPFHGKPMIAYSIEAAKESGCFDRIVVSTDDEEIAEVAKTLGAEVPFVRPVDLADDFATTLDVIQHAITALNLASDSMICCIYATAPFISARDIQQGYELLKTHKADYAFTATEFSFPIQRAFRLNKSDKVEMFYPEHLNTRSQDLEKAYHDAGQFYWGTYDAYTEGVPFFSANSVPVVLPNYRVQDIDTPDDWKRAELLKEIL